MGERQNRALSWRFSEQITTQTEGIAMQTGFANTDQSPNEAKFDDRTKRSIVGFVSGVALLGALTGCVGHVDGPRHGYAYAPPPPVYVPPPSVEVEASF